VRDFFIADILDWELKDDRHSMEHLMFALSKIPDIRARRHEHNGNSITVTPSIKGLAVIWDKDILIYAVSPTRNLQVAVDSTRADSWCHALVTSVFALAVRCRRIARRARSGGGSHDDLALGATLRSCAETTAAPSSQADQQILAGRAFSLEPILPRDTILIWCRMNHNVRRALEVVINDTARSESYNRQ
jgi:Replication initiator protein A